MSSTCESKSNIYKCWCRSARAFAQTQCSEGESGDRENQDRSSAENVLRVTQASITWPDFIKMQPQGILWIQENVSYDSGFHSSNIRPSKQRYSPFNTQFRWEFLSLALINDSDEFVVLSRCSSAWQIYMDYQLSVICSATDGKNSNIKGKWNRNHIKLHFKLLSLFYLLEYFANKVIRHLCHSPLVLLSFRCYAALLLYIRFSYCCHRSFVFALLINTFSWLPSHCSGIEIWL